MGKLYFVGTMLMLVIFQAFLISQKSLEATKGIDTLPPTFTLKTIKVNDDIIDCVDIHRQPAFDHPLLHEHTIQMRPSSYPKDMEDQEILTSSTDEKKQWETKEECSEGTIPILRMKQIAPRKRRTLSTRFLNATDSNQINNGGQSAWTHEYAVAYVRAESQRYYGAKASLNVWNPQVEREEDFSIAQIWVASRDGVVNTVEAGLQVDPLRFGDRKVRLFNFWTANGYKTGCFNMECNGFVQVGKTILGGPIQPVSTYGGKQYMVNITIFKDFISKDWWLKFQNNLVGYWPAKLFTSLKDRAEEVQWGGEVLNTKPGGQHTATHMGSGHFPGEGSGKASYFGDIKVVDSGSRLVSPYQPQAYATRPECYDIKIGKNTITAWGTYFYYGGPGRSKVCR